ncbi:hypothetical protein [Prescottella equi]|uniref:hypothetical protein n=1 Tax=Rhodococcus hoagii TaxID=43767 RepID=UPI000A10D9FF|nr:hypothetical protein [Prescottella equi]ORL34999.1 hypothetical protein A6I91_01985 [Prescottella equi]
MTTRGKQGPAVRKRRTLNYFRGLAGKRVVYVDVETRQPTEVGIVAHVDDRWVYVHYDGSPGPLATHPDNLRLPGDPL